MLNVRRGVYITEREYETLESLREEEPVGRGRPALTTLRPIVLRIMDFPTMARGRARLPPRDRASRHLEPDTRLQPTGRYVLAVAALSMGL